MVKVLHLLSDHKFVEGELFRFKNAGFENRFVFISDGALYTGASAGKLEQVRPFTAAFDNVIKEAAGFDIVYVYHLDYIKSYFINRVKEPIIIWCFYGTEIYNEEPAFKYSIYSPKTKKIIGINSAVIAAAKIKRLASRLKYSLFNKTPTYIERVRAIRRINYLTTFSQEEYDYMQQHVSYKLPAFLPLSVYTPESPQIPVIPQNNTHILLGHAASPDINHIDIIDMLTAARYKGRVVVPLSYGENDFYTKYIRQALEHSGLEVDILDTFLEPAYYLQKIRTCSAAIFNAYRQMAVGNILLALNNGIKLYLNEHNPSYRWLLNKGFSVFSVQKHLQEDIVYNRLALLSGEAINNARQYQLMNDITANKAYLQQIEAIALQSRVLGDPWHAEKINPC